MYGTVDGWIAYAAERGNTAPADASAEDAAAALVRARDYIKYTYVVNFTDPSVADESEEVEYATYVAADLELATPGFFTKTYTEAQSKILTEVKGIKWTPVASTGKASAFAPTSTLIDGMLRQFVGGQFFGALWV